MTDKKPEGALSATIVKCKELAFAQEKSTGTFVLIAELEIGGDDYTVTVASKNADDKMHARALLTAGSFVEDHLGIEQVGNYQVDNLEQALLVAANPTQGKPS